MKLFLQKYDFKIGFSLILIFALIVFLPFFIYTPLIQLSMDSFDYSYLAKLIFDGKIPAENLKIDLPVGFPIIIYFFKVFDLGFNSLVIIQLIFYVLAFIFLSYQASKFQNLGGIVVAIVFMLYSLNSNTIRHVFWIYTESFYTSFLILLSAGLLYYYRNKNKFSLFFILFSITGAVLLRSNGIYLMFIIIFLLYLEISKKRNYKFLILGLSFFVVITSSLNYVIKGTFAPYDYHRVAKVVNNFKTTPLKKMETKNISIIKTKKLDVFYKYCTSFYKRHASYYYSIQKTNYNSILKNNTFYNENQTFFDGKHTVKEMDSDLLSFMFNDIKEPDYASLKQHIFFETGKNNFWLYSIYAVQELIYLFRINLIVYILFLFFLIIMAFNSFKKNNFELLLLPLIHLASLFLLPFIHGRFVYRYLQVSEFVIYIFVIGFIISLKSKFNTIVK